MFVPIHIQPCRQQNWTGYREGKNVIVYLEGGSFGCYTSLPIDETECAKTVFFIFIPMEDGGLWTGPKKDFSKVTPSKTSEITLCQNRINLLL